MSAFWNTTAQGFTVKKASKHPITGQKTGMNQWSEEKIKINQIGSIFVSIFRLSCTRPVRKLIKPVALHI